jgi:hypothetical protein
VASEMTWAAAAVVASPSRAAMTWATSSVMDFVERGFP